MPDSIAPAPGGYKTKGTRTRRLPFFPSRVALVCGRFVLAYLPPAYAMPA